MVSFTVIYEGAGGGTVLIEGRVTDDSIEADVFDRTCQHHWRLKKG